MKNALPTSFEELLAHRYGRATVGPVGNARRFRDLLTTYYGQCPPASDGRRPGATAAVLSLSYDRTEGLPQRLRRTRVAEYVVPSSIDGAAPEEYVIDHSYGSDAEGSPTTPSGAAAPIDLPAAAASAAQECRVDLLAPLQSLAEERPSAAGSSARASLTPPPERLRTPALVEPSFSPTPSPSPGPSDDDFMADMEAILSGKKMYDPVSGTTLDKDKLVRPQPSGNRAGGDLPAPDGNGQAIFDRIAQSMQHANAYDLGTVELENRFADFDKISDIQQRAPAKKAASEQQAPLRQPASGAPVGSEDFIQDLDAIRQQQAPVSAPPPAPPPSPAAGVEAAGDTNAEIEALNLSPVARNAAYALKRLHPALRFTGGRRTKRDQARALAGAAVQNRKGIEQAYGAGPVRDACQRWVDDHPQVTARDEIAAGLEQVLNGFPDEQLASLSPHLSGAAFDVQPVEQGAEEIKKSIRELVGLETFLENEDGVATWHAQFR